MSPRQKFKVTFYYKDGSQRESFECYPLKPPEKDFPFFSADTDYGAIYVAVDVVKSISIGKL